MKLDDAHNREMSLNRRHFMIIPHILNIYPPKISRCSGGLQESGVEFSTTLCLDIYLAADDGGPLQNDWLSLGNLSERTPHS